MTDTHTEFIVTAGELSHLCAAVARAATAKARTQATTDAQLGAIRRPLADHAAALRAPAQQAAAEEAAWVEFEQDMDRRAALPTADPA